MTTALAITGLIVLGGLIVAWCNRQDPLVLRDTRERRALNLHHERSARDD
jgi:hypothetical protein